MFGVASNGWYYAIATMTSLTISLFPFLLAVAAICVSFCDGNSNVLCIASERKALLKLKHDFSDPSDRLSSWVETGDCCKWNGVVCHNSTGHVSRLHLAAPLLSVPDYFDPFDFAWREAYERSKLGGKINPSLLQLHHLNWLDLSNNNFSTIPIPEFLGFLGSLTYLNLSQSGFQGAIPHNLGNLSELQYLDLGGNHLLEEARSLQWMSGLSSLQYLGLSDVNLHNATDWLQVTISNLPSLLELHLSRCMLQDDPSPISTFNSTKLLAVLYLSSNQFSSVPSSIFGLHHLLTLDLSSNFLKGPIPDYFGNMSFLEVLDLSSNQFSSVPSSIFGLHHLLTLDLSSNSLKGPIPDYFGNMSFLEVVDLSSNLFSSSIPNSLYSLDHLQSLLLFYSNFQGKISSAIGNLSSLIHLGLSRNKLQGKLPASLGDLCKLKKIELSSNEIDQDMSEILEIVSRCSLDCLEELSMTDNQLSGHLTDQLGQLKNLAYLSLDRNNISGPIPLSIGELSSLKFFDVSENQLNGTLPPSFGKLANLETLDISQNLLEGVVSETHFSNLTKLTNLMASKNMLRFKPDSNWIPPFQCEVIQLVQWHLGPKFPQWLKFQKNLIELDISHARIADVVPTWFWNFSTQIQIVNLSSNQLTGKITYLNVGLIVDLSSNQFSGPLPRLFNPVGYLSLSRNLFSGSLSEFFCKSSEKTRMVFLHIDTNLLSGEIPDCWNLWQGLRRLNLANNNLTGKIPSSLGYTYDLLMLNLRNNSMFGELPSTLQNCSGLVILDLSENHFSGSVPAWIGEKLLQLMVLSLRSNNFDGYIPPTICALQSLQNLNLGHNNISGAIPKCLRNLSAMATKEEQKWMYYELLSERMYFERMFSWDGRDFKISFSASLMLKGREDEYSTALSLITSMDLSVNSLTGEIPKELGTLIGLRSLNLSGNILTGNIPDSFGYMDLMESLDLSMNQLHGGIPSSFSNLNFLNHFNVSYNNLSGQIPTSTQLQSFENSSYMANHLCGPPVSKNCSTKGVPSDATNNGGSSGRRKKVNGFYVSMVVGFVMGFGGVVAPLFFIRSWRHAYYQKLDHVGRKLYVFWATRGM